MKLLVAVVFVFANQALAAPAKDSALFTQGPEVFRVKNDKNETPIFRVLDGTPAEQALAMTVATVLNQAPETDPKIPVKPYLEVRIEKLTVLPSKKDPTQLELSARVSGHDLEVPDKVSRVKFLSGEAIAMTFPKTAKDVGGFDLRSEGALRLHLDRKTNDLVIEDARGKVAFNSMFTGEGEEKLQFKGRGSRETR